MRSLCVLSILAVCLTGPARAQPSPPARSFSGAVRPDAAIASGALRVKVTYDDLADPGPLTGVTVALVGYHARGAISVVEREPERGVVELASLDTSGHTAYQAFALVPRGGRMDRIASDPFVPGDGAAGLQLVLSSARRDDPAPPIDVGDALIPRRKVIVAVDGDVPARAPVELVDVATGDVLARGRPARGASHVVLDVGPDADLVVYARTLARRETYRSPAIPLVADRGARLAITVAPPLRQRHHLAAWPDGEVLVVEQRVRLENLGEAPLAPPGGIEVELPVGFQDLILPAHDRADLEPSARGVLVRGPLPPNGRVLHLRYALPVVDGRAPVTMNLPAGTVESKVVVRGGPGIDLAELPTGATVIRGPDHLALDGLAPAPTTVLRFTVVVPEVDEQARATRTRCHALRPSDDSARVGAPMVDFVARTLDGRKLRLSSRRGRLLLVHFDASWNRRVNDRRTLPGVARALGAELVTVVSDVAAADAARAFGTLPGPVVLDPPTDGETLGPITRRWGLRMVPETFLVDRDGVVRLHVVGERDWSGPQVLACLRAMR